MVEVKRKIGEVTVESGIFWQGFGSNEFCANVSFRISDKNCFVPPAVKSVPYFPFFIPHGAFEKVVVFRFAGAGGEVDCCGISRSGTCDNKWRGKPGVHSPENEVSHTAFGPGDFEDLSCRFEFYSESSSSLDFDA